MRVHFFSFFTAMNIIDLDAKLRAEYAEHVPDHVHIKYCFECPFSRYNTVPNLGTNQKFGTDVVCLCCLKQKKKKSKVYMDIHQPVATAKGCPLAALVNRRDYTFDKRIIPIGVIAAERAR